MNKAVPEKYKVFLDDLAEKVLICDGAMGTELQVRGISGCPDAANIDGEAREKVISVHLDYLESGSDIIQTNTFGANPEKLAAYGLGDRTGDINREAVLNARQAIDRYQSASSREKRKYIAGDVGPTGKLMDPSGDLKYEKAVDLFLRQVSALAENGADLILIETMMDINEALAAVAAARKVSDTIPVACTLSFGENGVTLMGNSAGESAGVLLDSGCDIVGANCSIGSRAMLEIVKKIRTAQPDARLIFQPNAGLPVLKEGKTAYDETPGIMAENISLYMDHRPSIVGACCGSTPAHIKKIAEIVRPG